MSLEQIVDYYDEMTSTLDQLYVQHSTELTMIHELLGIIVKAEELTPGVDEEDNEFMLEELREHWLDVS